MNDSDINRLRSLLNSTGRIDRGETRTQDGSGRDTTDETLKLYREKADQLLAGLTGIQLVEGYQQTDGHPPGTFTVALLTEIERRNLEI